MKDTIIDNVGYNATAFKEAKREDAIKELVASPHNTGKTDQEKTAWANETLGAIIADYDKQVAAEKKIQEQKDAAARIKENR